MATSDIVTWSTCAGNKIIRIVGGPLANATCVSNSGFIFNYQPQFPFLRQTSFVPTNLTS